MQPGIVWKNMKDFFYDLSKCIRDYGLELEYWKNKFLSRSNFNIEHTMHMHIYVSLLCSKKAHPDIL